MGMISSEELMKSREDSDILPKRRSESPRHRYGSESESDSDMWGWYDMEGATSNSDTEQVPHLTPNASAFGAPGGTPTPDYILEESLSTQALWWVPACLLSRHFASGYARGVPRLVCSRPCCPPPFLLGLNSHVYLGRAGRRISALVSLAGTQQQREGPRSPLASEISLRKSGSKILKSASRRPPLLTPSQSLSLAPVHRSAATSYFTLMYSPAPGNAAPRR